MEPAGGREEGGDEQLVETHGTEEHPAHGALHRTPAPSSAAARSRRIASCATSAVRGLAMSATSQPGHGAPVDRAAARNTRLLRFRRTAEPMRRPAMNATRPVSAAYSGEGAARMVTFRRAALRPCLKRRSISREDLMVCSATGVTGVLRAQGRTALAAPVRQDAPAGAGPHAGTEAVHLLALAVVRLIRALQRVLLGRKDSTLPGPELQECSGRVRGQSTWRRSSCLLCVPARSLLLSQTDFSPLFRKRVRLSLTSETDFFKICGYCGKRRTRRGIACG